MKPFVSPKPWSPDRPDTLVVCCADGRWLPHIQAFARSRVSKHTDFYSVPGGPAVVDPTASSFDHASVFDEAMALFVAAHQIRAIWLVAHEGCAFYQTRYGTNRDELERRQHQDLVRARDRISATWKGDVVLVYTRYEGERVLFHEIRS